MSQLESAGIQGGTNGFKAILKPICLVVQSESTCFSIVSLFASPCLRAIEEKSKSNIKSFHVRTAAENKHKQMQNAIQAGHEAEDQAKVKIDS